MCCTGIGKSDHVNGLLLSSGVISLLFLNLFYIGVEMINNAVLVSDVEQNGSVIHLPVSILFPMISPFTPLQNIEQSSLFPCWLSI